MNRRDFTRAVASTLRDNNIKKAVSIPKKVFTISDDCGNSRQFQVKNKDKEVVYTVDDVDRILDACICILEESLKRGEPVSFHGVGTLGLKYRKPRTAVSVNTGEKVTISGQYIPKFTFGNELKTCAKVYEMSLNDRLPSPEPYVFDDEEEED